MCEAKKKDVRYPGAFHFVFQDGRQITLLLIAVAFEFTIAMFTQEASSMNASVVRCKKKKQK